MFIVVFVHMIRIFLCFVWCLWEQGLVLCCSAVVAPVILSLPLVAKVVVRHN